MPVILFALLFFNPCYALTELKIQPVPAEANPVIHQNQPIAITTALAIGLEYNTSLINTRESMANSINNLKYQFESWEPTLGSINASYQISPSEQEGSGYPTGTIFLPSISQNFPTGTYVTINPPSYTTYRSSYALANPGEYGFSTPSMSITQNLLKGSDPNVNLAGLKMGIISNIKEKINVIIAYNATATSIASKFRALQLEKEKIKIYQKTELKLKTMIEVIKNEINAGKKNSLDLSEQELTLKKFSIDRNTAEQNILDQKNTFIDTLGISQSSKIEIQEPDLNVVPKLEDLSYYINASLKHNLTLRTYQLNVENAHLQLLQNQDEMRWSLTASASLSTGGKQTNSGSLSLNIPIQQTSNQNQVTSSRIEYFNQLRTYNKYKEYVRSTTSSKYQKLLNKIDAFKIQRERIDLSQKVMDVTTLKYSQGSINALQHSDKLESHINVLTNYVSAWVEMMDEYDTLSDFCGLLLKRYDIKITDPTMNYETVNQALMPSYS